MTSFIQFASNGIWAGTSRLRDGQIDRDAGPRFADRQAASIERAIHAGQTGAHITTTDGRNLGITWTFPASPRMR